MPNIGLFKNIGTLGVALTLLVFTGTLATPRLAGAAGPTSTPAIQTHADADLDGSGKPRKITFTIDSKTNRFTLTVAGSSLSLPYEIPEDPPKGFSMVAIDKADKYREIVVRCPGESDADTYLIFAYYGNELYKLAELSRSVEFPGDGSVRVEDWNGFWTAHDKYVLDMAKHTLNKVHQEFYYVGKPASVKKAFPIYTTPNKQTVVTNVTPGSKVIILLSAAPLTEGAKWYLLKTEDNLVGWVKEEIIQDHLDGIAWAG
jgi:hypothetical protein